jgi:hypothetical protein
MGNIPAAEAPDPWPKNGLAAKYKGFILKRIKPFLENNWHLNRNDVISDAIRLTWQASQKFEPGRGLDFSTYCAIGYLTGYTTRMALSPQRLLSRIF